MSEIFERASRKKLRFDTALGNLRVEDLWDLPLIDADASLNEIAKDLSRKLKEDETENFVEEVVKTDTIIKLKLDIVKRVIEVRLVWAEKAQKAAATKETKQKIMAAIVAKKDQNLQETSVEDLEQMLAEL